MEADPAELFSRVRRPLAESIIERAWSTLHKRLLPQIGRQQAQGKRRAVPRRAAFAKTERHEARDARNARDVILLLASGNMERDITELLTRPVGHRRV